MNATEPNKTEAPISKIRSKYLMDQYRKLINLVPHGRHKNQKGAKGAFGKAKRLSRK